MSKLRVSTGTASRGSTRPHALKVSVREASRGSMAGSFSSWAVAAARHCPGAAGGPTQASLRMLRCNVAAVEAKNRRWVAKVPVRMHDPSKPYREFRQTATALTSSEVRWSSAGITSGHTRARSSALHSGSGKSSREWSSLKRQRRDRPASATESNSANRRRGSTARPRRSDSSQAGCRSAL